MLHVPLQASAYFAVDNLAANPTTTPGTSITPGASDAEGSWTQLIAAGSVTSEIAGFYVVVNNGGTSATSKNHLLDIGIDPAGGTSYSAIISNLVCGQSPSIGALAPKPYYFPMRIPSGSSIAARVQGSAATAGSVRVMIRCFGQLSAPEAHRIGSFSETIGTITGSLGVSFTPGNAADGTWVSLGTTTLPMWWWQLGMQIDNTAYDSEIAYIDMAFGDATNKHIIGRFQTINSGAEATGIPVNPFTSHLGAYYPLPGGTELWVRGRCNNAPDTGYNAVAVGVG